MSDIETNNHQQYIKSDRPRIVGDSFAKNIIVKGWEGKGLGILGVGPQEGMDHIKINPEKIADQEHWYSWNGNDKKTGAQFKTGITSEKNLPNNIFNHNQPQKFNLSLNRRYQQ